MFIHPTAIVSCDLVAGENVYIGPYCTVGRNVVFGDNVVLLSHVIVHDRVSIGSGSIVYPFATIGLAPQDMKYCGEESFVEIGRKVQVREHVTIHSGTKRGIMKTTIGDGCLLMVASHVAHDCVVGEGVIMANNATLGGHVSVGDKAIIGGLAAIHQFVRIGAYAIVAGTAGVADDVIPFGSVIGSRAKIAGLNIIGLKRNGFSRDEIHALRKAFRALFVDSIVGSARDKVVMLSEELRSFKTVSLLCDFVGQDSSRSFCAVRNKMMTEDIGEI
ncbi:acyl-ACP--UDP-N-acetylglucosamine O-acyltransferase [Candidatus Hydrogenosomobacter endosymbioticus]|uniref:Acyl-[acyl-carrier-protein]--UDP-N-acetylglucosamine O-acyltransferase n=1 Tax=Candidatus Hydrogenosomobacter endosymbioticus TaxID=2558174 RepID=A0ABM7V9L4_9PROT|nr:acyl-ACP--UDP-N-acetylglucosamine O-acyltransferase [Candidatus Hydrogenosomobacter endosymbioticus]BDB96496.1 acyl-[acyl-carrier-protein]--UDP-N-acetylglucosamine O-acyltransferase [Candidatus Hydrogenosomobacter endosymbioticus]